MRSKHYRENIEDDGFTLYETVELHGTADAFVTPAVKTYPGFFSPDAETVRIEPDGSRILNYYYARRTYTVTVIPNGGTPISPVTQKYQSEWAIPSPTRTSGGFSRF